MGLKDELVVANDPVEETEEAGSENVSGENSSAEVVPVNKSDDSQNKTDSESKNEQEVENEETPEAPVVGAEVQEESVVEEEEEEEEDVEDPMDNMKEQCSEKAEAQKYKALLDECNERVASTEGTEETCTQELYDFLHCVDHCVSKTIFSSLK